MASGHTFLKYFFKCKICKLIYISISVETIIQHITLYVPRIFIKYFNKCLVELLLKTIKQFYTKFII